MKCHEDDSEDVCLLSLVEEDDFNFNLYQHDLFLLDVKEAEKDSFKDDGESFQHKDTRFPSEPRYELRKGTHSQQQQNSMLLLIHNFKKLSIHKMNEEDLSKTLKESVDQKGLSFPPQIIF